MSKPASRFTAEDLSREGGELLPDKEVLSILDLFVNLDIAIDLAAPVDLAIAANANVAAPIDAAATANVLSAGSTATALAQQGVMLDQFISGDAIALAPQDAVIDQGNDVVDGGGGGDETGGSVDEPAPAGTDGGTTDPGTTDAGGAVDEVIPGTGEVVDTVTEGGLLDGPLLNVEVDAAIDADLAAPVAGAVAANANVAAPIDAAVAANIGTIASNATAVADQTAIINQTLEDVTAQATADQDAEITQ